MAVGKGWLVMVMLQGKECRNAAISWITIPFPHSGSGQAYLPPEHTFTCCPPPGVWKHFAYIKNPTSTVLLTTSLHLPHPALHHPITFLCITFPNHCLNLGAMLPAGFWRALYSPVLSCTVLSSLLRSPPYPLYSSLKEVCSSTARYVSLAFSRISLLSRSL